MEERMKLLGLSSLIPVKTHLRSSWGLIPFRSASESSPSMLLFYCHHNRSKSRAITPSILNELADGPIQEATDLTVCTEADSPIKPPNIQPYMGNCTQGHYFHYLVITSEIVCVLVMSDA